ncbi:MAG: hypothetical protein GWP56_15825 [Gammaproteobacteria bacterium]|nr:hypothetical protein [Gammaproteobacteria bacterium]
MFLNYEYRALDHGNNAAAVFPHRVDFLQRLETRADTDHQYPGIDIDVNFKPNIIGLHAGQDKYQRGAIVDLDTGA